MPNIDLTVKDKRADGTGVIVCGNSDYTVTWELDEEWVDYDTKTMRVCLADGTYIDTVFSGTVCPVPVLSVTGWVSIGLFAGDIHTSTPATLIAVEAITTPAGSPAAPTEDVYAQIMERLAELEAIDTEDIEKAVREYLTENPIAAASMRVEGGYIQFSPDGEAWDNVIAIADLQGEKGDTGPRGEKGADGNTPVKGVDYWTEADKAELVEDVLEQVPSGSGDSSLGITGATVGQTVKITAVDEDGSPTAWEPVDMPTDKVSNQFRLIRTVTIPEDITTDTSGVAFAERSGGGITFAFDTDEAGQPFSVCELIIRSVAGTPHSASSFAMDITRATPAYIAQVIGPAIAIGVNGATSRSEAYVALHADKSATTFGATFNGGETNNVTNPVVLPSKYFPRATVIEKINCFMSNLANYGFSAGSTFTFLGR